MLHVWIRELESSVSTKSFKFRPRVSHRKMETEFCFEPRKLTPGFPMHQGEVHINIQSLGQETYPFLCTLRELE